MLVVLLLVVLLLVELLLLANNGCLGVYVIAPDNEPHPHSSCKRRVTVDLLKTNQFKIKFSGFKVSTFMMWTKSTDFHQSRPAGERKSN